MQFIRQQNYTVFLADSISQDIKNIIKIDSYHYFWTKFEKRRNYNGGIDYAIKEHGMKIVRWSEADMKKAMDLMQPLHADYVDRMNKKGLPGQEILDFVKARAAINSKKYPPAY